MQLSECVVSRETSYSADEQRVVDWLISRTKNQVGAGDDPIGFLLASYELIHAELAKRRQLWKVCEQFVADQDISCAETIYQTDRVIENAYLFVEKVCDIVGYAEMEDDE